MRTGRLLTEERGSAPVESVFAIVLLVLLTLGALQVGFALYARNVVASAAHEGARVLAERGAFAGDAGAVARSVVERAAGGLVEDLRVDVSAAPHGTARVVKVDVRGAAAPFGPVPLTLPLSATATSVVETP
ncbi:MAG TPA: TadE/TadG family type IV pilus assembly protein [Actinomycetota bacterium]|nr:TadE/TadG family type IV pilus assembly protein [Actinomycetota bacterium]